MSETTDPHILEELHAIRNDIAGVKETMARVDERLAHMTDHSGRISALEQWREAIKSHMNTMQWLMSGAILILPPIAAILVQWLMK